MADNVLNSVDNALWIIEIMADEGPELGVTEISSKTGLGKSTVHRLLNTLERRNFVVQTSLKGKYKLTPKISNIGLKVIRQVSFLKECRPFIEKLSAQTGESLYIVMFDGDKVTYIDEVIGRNENLLGSIRGIRMPAYLTAAGKLFLANLSKEALEDYFKRNKLKPFTKKSIVDKNELLKELDVIRREGYSEDHQEAKEGQASFAFPIRDYSGELVLVISASGAESSLNAKKAELLPKLKSVSEEISLSLGWQQQK